MLKIPEEITDKLYKEAEDTVIRIRGSDDVPGFRACVDSEFANLCRIYVETNDNDSVH